MEFAQAATAGAESIGQVTALQGTVTITRTDGTKVKANDGAPIFQGDVIETGSGAIGITVEAVEAVINKKSDVPEGYVATDMVN